MRAVAAVKSDAGTPFSLVNIAIQEEAASAPPPRQRPEAPPIPAAPAVPAAPDSVLAEQYLEQEERADEDENAAEIAEAAVSAERAEFAEASGAVPGNADAASDAVAKNAALTAEYARRNYTYIQRRIRDRLVYPAPARRAGIQGVTQIAFTIHEDGQVSAVTIQQSSGHAVLDNAAIETVFAAAPFPRPPAPARLAIPLSFKLR